VGAQNAAIAAIAARVTSLLCRASRSGARLVGSGSRVSGLPVGDPGGRVSEGDPVGLKDGEDRAQALPGGGAGGARGRQRGEHLLAGDLPQRDVASGSPRPQRGQRPAQLGLDGAGPAGPRARWLGAAAQHHLKPGPQLAGHRVGQASDGAGEPCLDGGDAVVVEHPRLGQHVAYRPGRQAGLRQQQGLAGLDRRAGSVLQPQQDAYPGPADGTWLAAAWSPVHAWVSSWRALRAGDWARAAVVIAPATIPAGLLAGALLWRAQIALMASGAAGWSPVAPAAFNERQWRRSVRTAAQRVRAPGGVPLLSRRGNPQLGAVIRTVGHRPARCWNCRMGRCGRTC